MSLIVTATKQCVYNRVDKRGIFYFINIVFNYLDKSRRRELGPDRTCAEWILRNGGAIKWKDSEKYLNDYNELPPEGTVLHIEEVDATESSIMHYGFIHFEGCKFINKIILHKCSYLENKALKELGSLKDTLKYLQVSSCGNITDTGLLDLRTLKNLDKLVLFDLPYVKDKSNVVNFLQSTLMSCKIDYK